MLNIYRNTNEWPSFVPFALFDLPESGRTLGSLRQETSSMDVAKIEAKITEGVLEVHLPKSEPYRVRMIEVTGA